MKKMLLGIFALSATMILASCGGDSRDSVSVEPQPSASEQFSDEVLADAEHDWVIAGQYLLADGETVNGWAGSDKNKMTAASLKTVAETAGAEVATALAAKNVKHLYVYQGAQLGVNDADWKAEAVKDGKKVSCNGSFALKAIKTTYDAEDGTYLSEQWIPDPHTAHAESLTPSTYFVPTWTEAPDELGFSWASNPVCIGGAGVYTVVVAEYNNASSATEAQYGIALIKTAEKESEYGAYEEVADLRETTVWSIIGDFTNGWSEDIDLVAVEGKDYTYAAEFTTTAENQAFKVRANKEWAVSFGASSLAADVNKELFGEAIDADGKPNGNILAKVAGTYTLTLTVGFAGVSISIAA